MFDKKTQFEEEVTKAKESKDHQKVINLCLLAVKQLDAEIKSLNNKIFFEIPPILGAEDKKKQEQLDTQLFSTKQNMQSVLNHLASAYIEQNQWEKAAKAHCHSLYLMPDNKKNCETALNYIIKLIKNLEGKNLNSDQLAALAEIGQAYKTATSDFTLKLSLPTQAIENLITIRQALDPYKSIFEKAEQTLATEKKDYKRPL